MLLVSPRTYTHELTYATNVPQSLLLCCSSCMEGQIQPMMLILPRELHFHGQLRRKLLQERHPGTSWWLPSYVAIPYRGRRVIIFSSLFLHVGSTEPRQENGGSTREPGMEQETGSTQRTSRASAHAASLLMQLVAD